ncbi:hypothetical protein RUM43_003300 [Polyplax serrata]|uniref:Uncharacterized protein n=1 Tax=Polyplax serrata TaxID=468196 RepID=A0AAN8RWX4_POLSC
MLKVREEEKESETIVRMTIKQVQQRKGKVAEEVKVVRASSATTSIYTKECKASPDMKKNQKPKSTKTRRKSILLRKDI